LAEAYILAGAYDNAAHAIGAAARYKGTSLADKASTLKQLRRLLKRLGQPNDILKPLQPKAVLHYTGHMIAPHGKHGRITADNEAKLQMRVAAAIDEINPGAAFGALASGADLHVVLPFAQGDFIDVSVLPADEGGHSPATWEMRFHKCLKAASSVTYLTDQPYLGADILFGLGAKLAMGRALLHARHVAGSATQLAIWDQKPTDFPAGTAVDIGEWEALGQAQHIVDVADLGRTAPSAKKMQPRSLCPLRPPKTTALTQIC